jgi:arylsulfatase A
MSRVIISCFVLCLPCTAVLAQPAGDTRPNVLLILVDDLGWADLACYGSDLHETPNIDGLAAQSLKFTDAYAPSPVCSPTRASLMSGEHPARLHMTVWREAAQHPPENRPLIPPRTEENLPLSKITLGERFQAAGYRTAHIGKWHLGDASHFPQAQGFDIGIGGTHWGCPTTFFYPYRGPSHGEFRYIPGLGLGQNGDYLTDRLTDKAIGFMEQVDAAGDTPFFLYMAYYTVHTPIEAPANLVDRYRQKLQPNLRHANATYAAMVHSLDQNVGRLLDTVHDSHMTRPTIVILTSDNGGFSCAWRDFAAVTNNAPLRSGKGSLYEGGIRVPLLIHWPSLTSPHTNCDEPVLLTDLHQTLIDGLELDHFSKPDFDDGVSLMPLLTNQGTKLPARQLYWHYPHYYPTTTPVSAMRTGVWKLIEYLEDSRIELYNLKDDLGEQHDLANDYPKIAQEMQANLKSWRKSVDAQMPTPNRERERD